MRVLESVRECNILTSVPDTSCVTNESKRVYRMTRLYIALGTHERGYRELNIGVQICYTWSVTLLNIVPIVIEYIHS